jgi:hypothetical protein
VFVPAGLHAMAITRRSTPVMRDMTNVTKMPHHLGPSALLTPRRMTLTACDDCVARLAVLSLAAHVFVFDLVSALPASCLAFVLTISSLMPRPFVQPPAIMVPPVCGESCAISRVVLSINGNTCSRHLCTRMMECRIVQLQYLYDNKTTGNRKLITCKSTIVLSQLTGAVNRYHTHFEVMSHTITKIAGGFEALDSLIYW